MFRVLVIRCFNLLDEVIGSLYAILCPHRQKPVRFVFNERGDRATHFSLYRQDINVSHFYKSENALQLGNQRYLDPCFLQISLLYLVTATCSLSLIRSFRDTAYTRTICFVSSETDFI